MAKEYGVKFRFDAAIFPCFNEDKGPLGLRVTPEEVIEKEFSDRDRAQEWKNYFERTKGFSVSETLYNCGAGLTTFHIDPYGNLQPCVMTIDYQYNLLEGDFLAGWNDVIPLMRDKKAGAAYRCNQCEKRTLCGFCPPFSRLEKGTEEAYSEYLCALGQLRFEAVQHIYT
jgi:radical SAM protein with 4Fe4S-binding SPASM domain